MLKQNSMIWYIAHPYSNDPEVNIRSVNVIAADLFQRGVHFYSPISMTHPIHEANCGHPDYAGDGTDWELWLRFDEALMEKCDGLILCPGWENSKGCCREIESFRAARKPIFLLEDFIRFFEGSISIGREV